MNICVDFKKEKGKIRPLHGVGQPPFLGTDFSYIDYLYDAGIPFSRLHDVGGAYGGNLYVDVPNLFRDFNADENDPASYDFAFTDLLISALFERGVEPFFRLGVTIENSFFVKAYRIYPPQDFAKWARICEHIIRHYTEGWADGFLYKIRYWEIWNEPDNSDLLTENMMWLGTMEQFFELYNVASKHLKTCFPHLRIGGYASCGFYAHGRKEYGSESGQREGREDYFLHFFDKFLKYVKREGCPLDFFSWHSYDTIEMTVKYADYAYKRLCAAGFPNIEIILNEWNVHSELYGTYEHASLTAGMMLALQDCRVDSAMFYDARIGTSTYSGMFNPLTKKPHPAYYAFIAFNRLYTLGTEVDVKLSQDGVYALAAKKDRRGALVISNTNDAPIQLSVEANGTPTMCFITADGLLDEKTELPKELPPFSILTIQYQL